MEGMAQVTDCRLSEREVETTLFYEKLGDSCICVKVLKWGMITQLSVKKWLNVLKLVRGLPTHVQHLSIDRMLKWWALKRQVGIGVRRVHNWILLVSLISLKWKMVAQIYIYEIIYRNIFTFIICCVTSTLSEVICVEKCTKFIK